MWHQQHFVCQTCESVCQQAERPLAQSWASVSRAIASAEVPLDGAHRVSRVQSNVVCYCHDRIKSCRLQKALCMQVRSCSETGNKSNEALPPYCQVPLFTTAEALLGSWHIPAPPRCLAGSLAKPPGPLCQLQPGIGAVGSAGCVFTRTENCRRDFLRIERSGAPRCPLWRRLPRASAPQSWASSCALWSSLCGSAVERRRSQILHPHAQPERGHCSQTHPSRHHRQHHLQHRLKRLQRPRRLQRLQRLQNHLQQLRRRRRKLQSLSQSLQQRPSICLCLPLLLRRSHHLPTPRRMCS